MANRLQTLFLLCLTSVTSLAVVISLFIAPSALRADARFDLAGPKLEVHVTRSGVTLPIAEVPNLQPGDRIWLHPDFPPTQSVHYLLVAVFLRGTTNPPPDNWFNRIETWKPQVRAEGVSIVVPAEAQQVLLFLAPETSGDFTTLRSAVKGRPGIFVRASQDLNAAGFEEARIERYLNAMRSIPSADAKQLAARSDLLARTLALKPNAECFKLPLDQQVNCLTQSGNQLLLDDGHGQSVAANLTSGAANDFINASSYTTLAGGGLYSAYVGAIIDLVRLTSTLHTAQYQYIPAIAFPSPSQPPTETATRDESPVGQSKASQNQPDQFVGDKSNQDQLNLRLNAPPSFHNPKSVIVIGLPAIQSASPPPLVAADPSHVACLLKPKLVLGLVGAPLVYSTGFAHDLVLHRNTANPTPDIPLTPDAFEGGLVVAPRPQREVLPLGAASNPLSTTLVSKTIKTPPLNTVVGRHTTATESTPAPAPVEVQVTATVKGMWGFDSYTGPTLPVEQLPGKAWRLLSSDPLVAGQENHLALTATGVACVESITAEMIPPSASTANDASVHESAITDPPASPASSQTPTKLEWKPLDAAAKPSAHSNEIALTLPLGVTAPEAVRILIHQYGDPAPVVLTARALGEPAKLAGLTLHANDSAVTLTGTSLDQVRQITVGSTVFLPGPSDSALKSTSDASPNDASNADTLILKAAVTASTSRLTAGERFTAKVQLKDGRELGLPVTISPARPVVTLLSRSVTPAEGGVSAAAETAQAETSIEVPPDDLPLTSRFTFFLKSAENFPRAEHIEIASPDGALEARLGVAEGTLVLANRHTVLATIDPLKLFGPSAFGPLRLRAVAPDGTPGEWIPLVTLIRLPTLTELRCPAQRSGSPRAQHRASPKDFPEHPLIPQEGNPQPCTLVGSNLYLIDSVSPTEDFAQPTTIPEGSVATTIPLGRPSGNAVYLRLRDDPATTDVASVHLVVTPAFTSSPDTAPTSTHVADPAADPATAPSTPSPDDQTPSQPPPTQPPQL